MSTMVFGTAAGETRMSAASVVSREDGYRGIRRPMLELLLLVALAAALDLAAIAISGSRFVNADQFFPIFGAAVGSLAGLSLYLRIRMPELRWLIRLLEMIAIYIVMCVVMMTYQYALALAPAWPISHAIEAADHATGFHWLAVSRSANAIPGLSPLLAFCYRNWMREFAVVFVVLAYLRKFEELEEFTTVHILAGMATLSISGLIDPKSYEAVAAWVIPGIHFPAGVSPIYLEKIKALRAGLDRVMNFNQIIGLVSFPSFHAGAALLLAVYSRRIPYAWPVFLAFNLCIILGAITDGGHNLMDVFAGLAFAAAAVAASQALRRAGWLARAADAVAALFQRGRHSVVRV